MPARNPIGALRHDRRKIRLVTLPRMTPADKKNDGSPAWLNRNVTASWAWLCVGIVVAVSLLAQRNGLSVRPIAGADQYAWTMRLMEDRLPWAIRGWNGHEWNGANAFYFYGFLPQLVCGLAVGVFSFLPATLVFNLIIVGCGAALPVTTFLYARREFGPLAGVLSAAMTLSIVSELGGIGSTTQGWGNWPNGFALTLFPLAMYAYARFRQDPTRRSALLLGILPSAPFFGHVMVGVFSWLILCIQSLFGWISTSDRLRFVLKLWGVLVLGGLLSAFWWGPMFFKHDYVRTGSGGWSAPWPAFLAGENPYWSKRFIACGLLFLVVQKRWDMLAATVAALALAYAKVTEAAADLDLIEAPGVFLLRAYWRFYAPAKILLFVSIGGWLGRLLEAANWTRWLGAALLSLLIAGWMASQYSLYWETGSKIRTVSQEWLDAIDRVSDELADRGRFALDHAGPRRRDDFDFTSLFWADQALVAAGRHSVSGGVGEMSLAPEWSNVLTHFPNGHFRTLRMDGLYERAKFLGVSDIVAATRRYKRLLVSDPERFEKSLSAGVMEVFRVHGEVEWALALRDRPTLVFTSAKRWQALIRQRAGERRCKLLVWSPKPIDAWSEHELLRFDRVILDEAESEDVVLELNHPGGVWATNNLLDQFPELQGKIESVDDFWELDVTGVIPKSGMAELACERPAPGTIDVEVSSGATGVFVKESFFPNFKATLNGDNVDVYMAAPNMMYVPVSEPGILKIRFKTDRIDYGFLALSALAGLILFVVLLRWGRPVPGREPHR
jgi:hypothetical protein